ncbi:hypothetical protein GP486_006776 [Trichoglossum hirsutum]|uniref:Major facilitator superfamily (MFS) profile domain-containing protein n=1 Tax=Trichoglossum hirsutum TaxID=265104 RepID=A0A9P8IGP6_9PEZI|nr:hypothetical protein GP486_006776 [Trichoglossum hirsutum]
MESKPAFSVFWSTLYGIQGTHGLDSGPARTGGVCGIVLISNVVLHHPPPVETVSQINSARVHSLATLIGELHSSVSSPLEDKNSNSHSPHCVVVHVCTVVIPGKLDIPASMKKSDINSTLGRALPGCVGDEKPPSRADTEAAVEKDVPPDGGLMAWLQVFAAFMLVMNSRGLTTAFGVFQEYYTNTMLKGINPSSVSWIGSLQSFLLMFGGVFCGRLLDAGHLRIQLCVGIALQFLGMMLTSFATRYPEILVSQGLCVGAGSSFLWLPSAVVVVQYFDSKIMLATSIAASGSPTAGVVFPILVRKLIDHVHYAWAMRIVAFIVLAMNIFCLALMRLRIPPRKGGGFFNLSIFRDPPYCAFVGAMTFLYMSVYIPFFYIQDYAHDIGLSPALQTYILSILNAASILSRVGPSWLADILIAVIIVYGLFSGVLVSLPPATIASITKNPNEYGTRIGMAFAVCAFGVLTGNPIGGALLTSASASGGGGRRSYMRLWLFASGLMFISGVLVILAKYLVGRRTKANEECDLCSNADQNETQEEGEEEEEFEKEKEENHNRVHHHHQVVPIRRCRRWHQVLIEDVAAMQGVSVW